MDGSLGSLSSKYSIILTRSFLQCNRLESFVGLAQDKFGDRKLECYLFGEWGPERE